MRKKPPSRAEQLHRTLKESVDFKGRHKDKEKQLAKLKMARKWLQLPLNEFLSEMKIGPNDPEYEVFVAIWSEYHE